MSGEQINNAITQWAKKNGFVILGFAGFGGYETYKGYTDQQVEDALRHQRVDHIIELIMEDKVIEDIQQKNRQQDRHIRTLEDVIGTLSAEL